jgi:SAM-dependent methyltransferase
VSLELIETLGAPLESAVIDVGGGASLLADQLLERGFRDVTVLDISASALEAVGRRRGATVHLIHEDLLHWRPVRSYDLWHDRAVFHFLVAEGERDRYLERVHEALRAGGFVVLGTFAPDAPRTCSGLPVARYSGDDLGGLLGPRLELVVERRERHTTPRSVVQPFTWVAGRMRPAARSRRPDVRELA